MLVYPPKKSGKSAEHQKSHGRHLCGQAPPLGRLRYRGGHGAAGPGRAHRGGGGARNDAGLGSAGAAGLGVAGLRTRHLEENGKSPRNLEVFGGISWVFSGFLMAYDELNLIPKWAFHHQE